MLITTVHSPDSLAAATSLSAAGGWILGGGTIVMRQVNAGASPAAELVSLHRLGMAGVRTGGDTGDDSAGASAGDTVTIGATTTLADLAEELDFLRDAVRSIASPTIRNTATVGGNLFAAQPYGDLAVCLLALDADAEIADADGRRRVPVADGVPAGGIVTEVSFTRPAPGTWFYHKAMRRKMNSAAIVTVAAVVESTGGVVTAARIALGGVAPRAVRATSAEQVLIGRPLDRETVELAGQAALDDVDPADDAYASAWYRRRVLPVHLGRALLR
jgi:CO/xanthine dehydrogenase FAD-binding subunit